MTDFLLFGLGVIVTMLGYFLHQLSQDVKDIEHAMNNCPKEYVLKTDYQRDITEIKDILSKIFEKIDRQK